MQNPRRPRAVRLPEQCELLEVRTVLAVNVTAAFYPESGGLIVEGDGSGQVSLVISADGGNVIVQDGGNNVPINNKGVVGNPMVVKAASVKTISVLVGAEQWPGAWSKQNTADLRGVKAADFPALLPTDVDPFPILIIGSRFADRLAGSPDIRNDIVGGDYDFDRNPPPPATEGDIVVGGALADKIRVEKNDTVYAGAGDDDIVVDSQIGAAAVLYAGNGADIHGQLGNDTIVGSNHPDTIRGGDGNDTITAGNNLGVGGDVIYGGPKNDTISGSPSADTIKGDAGNDSIKGGDGNDEIRGDVGEDEIFGDRDDDRLFGGDEDDKIEGGVGDDTIKGDSGKDVLRGQEGKDIIKGDEGDDLIFGGANDDVLYGGPDMDLVHGGPGKDQIEGGTADDILWTGDGAADQPFADIDGKGQEGCDLEDGVKDGDPGCNDDDGTTAQIDPIPGDTDNVETAQEPQLPSAEAGDAYYVVADNWIGFLELDASLSFSANGMIVSFDWDLDGDGEFDDASGEFVTVSWTELASLGWLEGEIRQISLRVTDDGGDTGIDTAQVTVQSGSYAMGGGGPESGATSLSGTAGTSDLMAVESSLMNDVFTALDSAPSFGPDAPPAELVHDDLLELSLDANGQVGVSVLAV